MSFDQQIKVPGSVHIPGAGSSGSSTPSLADIIAGTLGVALLLGSVTPPAAGTRCIYGTGTDLVRDVGGKHIWQVGGADALQISAVTGGAGHYLKQSAAGGVLSSGVIAAADLPTGIDATKLGTGTVTSAILAYLDATSSIQTQLNGKEGTITTLPPSKGGLGLDGSASSGFAKFTAGSVAIAALSAADIPSLAGSIITSGTVGAAYLGSGTANSTTYLRGDNTWGAAPADASKLALDGSNSMSGALSWTGTQVSAGATISNDWRGSAGQLTRNVPTGATIDDSVNGVVQMSSGANGLLFSANHTAPAAGIYSIWREQYGLRHNVPTGGTHSFYENGVSQAYLSATGLIFPIAHTAPSSSAYGLYRDPSLLYLVASTPINGFFAFRDNGTISHRVSSLYGIIFDAGGNWCHASIMNLYRDGTTADLNCVTANSHSFRHVAQAAAVANTTWVTIGSVTGASLPTMVAARFTVFVTGIGSAELYWDGTTLSVWKGLADTNLVAASSAASGEVAFRVNANNIQASNNTGSSKNASCSHIVCHV